MGSGHDRATPSCIASATSRSCAAHRIRASWCCSAHELGYSALALTDECSMAGVVRAHEAAKECELKLIIGSEFRTHRRSAPRAAGADAEGLCTDLHAHHAGAASNPPRASTSCRALDFENELERVPGAVGASDANRCLRRPAGCASCFPDAAGLQSNCIAAPDDAQRLAHLRQTRRYRWALPLVAAGDVHMHVRERRALQDTVTAIRHRLHARASRSSAVSERRTASATATKSCRRFIRENLLEETLRIARALRVLAEQPALQLSARTGAARA